MDPPSSEMEIPSVRMVSIARGNMDDIQIPQRQSSCSDFNALREQQQQMQEKQNQILDQQKKMQEKQNQMEEYIKTLEQKPGGSGEEHVGLLGIASRSLGVLTSEEEVPATQSMVEARYDKYELPESTYSLLMTEEIRSVPFVTGIIAWAFSMMCLGLALWNEFDKGSPENRLGIPAGVQKEVIVAQYLGVLVGVLMEDEIPQGLELIGKGAEQKLSRRASLGDGSGGVDDTTRLFGTRRVFLPALLRLSVGYMFIICLFLVVVQESTVLDIFFDVLALEFVENIDDVIFGLSKRGFFGPTLRDATNKTHYIETTRASHRFRRWTKRIIRFVYISNILCGVVLLSVVTRMQKKGHYRCKSVSVVFGDAEWEEAYVKNKDGRPEKRILIYSHFNGVYEENGKTHHGRPKYIERNKEDGGEFKNTVPAEIVFCEGIDAWVFRHDNISVSEDDNVKENECSWLLRSATTHSFDLVELADEIEWLVWTGHIESEYKVSIECNECFGTIDAFDCNFHGDCVNRECKCKPDRFGKHCEFQRPCKVIRSEKDNATALKLLGDPKNDTVDFIEVYGRPMYVIHNMKGKPSSLLRLGYSDDDDDDEHYTNSDSHDKHHPVKYFANDDFFESKENSKEFRELLENYTFVLRFSGQRWYGQISSPNLTAESVNEEDYHAFWDNSFSGGMGSQDDRTVIISASDVGGSPVGIDFYEMRRRIVSFGTFKSDYSQYGVLIPLVDYDGSGFFHCNED